MDGTKKLITIIRSLISALQSQRALAMDAVEAMVRMARISAIVQPETVVRWDREGLRVHWSGKLPGALDEGLISSSPCPPHILIQGPSS